MLNLPASSRPRLMLGLKGLAGLIVALALAVVVWRVVFLPREAAEQKGKAIVAEESAEAAGKAAEGALTVTNEVHREYVRIEEITRRNDDAIKSAPGADTRAPDLADALRDSLRRLPGCEREPGCAALPGDGGGIGPAGPDAVGQPSGE